MKGSNMATYTDESITAIVGEHYDRRKVPAHRGVIFSKIAKGGRRYVMLSHPDDLETFENQMQSYAQRGLSDLMDESMAVQHDGADMVEFIGEEYLLFCKCGCRRPVFRVTVLDTDAPQVAATSAATSAAFRAAEILGEGQHHAEEWVNLTPSTYAKLPPHTRCEYCHYNRDDDTTRLIISHPGTVDTFYDVHAAEMSRRPRGDTRLVRALKAAYGDDVKARNAVAAKCDDFFRLYDDAGKQVGTLRVRVPENPGKVLMDLILGNRSK